MFNQSLEGVRGTIFPPFAKVIQTFYSPKDSSDFLDIWHFTYDLQINLEKENNIVNPSEQRYADNLINRYFREKWIKRLLILKYLLALYLDRCAKEIKVVVGNGVKPFAPGYRIEFNTTHSDDILIIAVSNKSVGIDFELASKWDKNLARSGLHLNRQERIHAFSLADSNRVLYERALWSLKEAIVKMTGNGLKQMSHALETSPQICIPLNEQIKLQDRNGNNIVSHTNSIYSFAIATCLNPATNYSFKV